MRAGFLAPGRATLRLGAVAGRPSEPDRELAPLAGPFAPGLDGSAVHLDELLDHGEPDAQAPLAPGERAVPLGEQLEHLGSFSGGMPWPRSLTEISPVPWFPARAGCPPPG